MCWFVKIKPSKILESLKKMLMVVEPLEVLEPLEAMVMALPPIHKVCSWCLAL
jgi:hypothetical protein